MKKLKKVLSLTLALVLSLSLMVPAFAAEEQRIIANGEVYDRLLAALMSEPEDKPLTVTLESDVDLTGGVAIVIGSSDYGGLFGGQTMTIASHDITIDLNGHTLTGNEGASAFQVQDGYQLKIIDSSENQTGELVSQGDEDVQVEEGGSYQPAAPAAPAAPAQPAASGSANYKVNTSGGTGLNVRTGPGIKYKKAAPALPQGTEVEIAEIDGDWGKLADGTGWVYMLALDKLAGAEPAKPAQPVPPAAPAEIPEDALAYTVKEGDTLGFISVNYYGSNAKSAALYKANKAAFQATKGKLVPGMTLILPAAIGKTARIAAPAAGEGETLYTVKLGDTLGKIAAAEYGKVGDYKAIFERNSDRLKNANTIYEGQVIVLPVIQK